jgi:ABC-type branched-subunit amino acid transport system substrate-binding protein
VAGVNAAVREINAAGGVLGMPVEVVNRDAGDSSTETAEASLADLVTRGVDVVIGPSSSVLAERILPLAVTAQIPLVSPAATSVRLSGADTEGWLFRTVASTAHEGAALATLLADAEQPRVALLTAGDGVGDGLGSALDETGGELVLQAEVTVADPADPASGVDDLVAQVVDADPDAVVLDSADAGAQTQALITALTAAGFGGQTLWLTSRTLADYSVALPAGALEGVRGIVDGASASPDFAARVRLEDPGLLDLRYAAEAYDATMLAALAATLAGDDGGAAIARELRAASVGGIKCTSFGECLDVLGSRDDIDYDGASGAVDLDEAGDVAAGGYGVFLYDAANRPGLTGSATG